MANIRPSPGQGGIFSTLSAYLVNPPRNGEPNDWWTIDAEHVINPHMTVAVGYGHFGTVANHTANSVWGVTAKWEF